jgi:hypothetical protein
MSKMIYIDDSYIPTAPALQISRASDDLLHQLQKKSEAGTVINSPVSLQIFVKHVPERGGRHQ